MSRFPKHCAGARDDLHAFDLSTMIWTEIYSAIGSAERPAARYFHGFTSANGKLYVHGGFALDASSTGIECKDSISLDVGVA